MDHTKRGHYSPCFVDGHELLVTRVTHPLFTLHEKIATFLVLVRVVGVAHEPQQRASGHKTVHALGLNDLSRMVTMEKFFHHQPTRVTEYGPKQDLHAEENLPGVWGNLGDGQP